MQLICGVFDTKSALVALLAAEKVYIMDSINFSRGDFPWRSSFCGHSLTPPNHQTMVVEDAQKDHR